MIPTPQCFFFSWFDAIAVSSASPSTSHPFSFTLSPKLKEKASFEDTRKPSSSSPRSPQFSKQRDGLWGNCSVVQCIHTFPETIASCQYREPGMTACERAVFPSPRWEGVALSPHWGFAAQKGSSCGRACATLWAGSHCAGCPPAAQTQHPFAVRDAATTFCFLNEIAVGSSLPCPPFS